MLLVLVTTLCIILAAQLVLSLRNLFLSPLRSVPGPRLAACSSLWLWFLDLSGNAPKVIKNLHGIHGKGPALLNSYTIQLAQMDLSWLQLTVLTPMPGPIVRISPNEISVDDISVYNGVLYRQAPQFIKASYFYNVFETSGPNMFTATSPKEHSQLRRLLSHGFSRRSVLEFVPQVWKTMDSLTSILSAKCTSGDTIELSKMYRCLMLDIIGEFAYGEPFGALFVPDFQEAVLEAFDRFHISNFVFMMFPSVKKYVMPALALLPFQLFKAIPNMVKKVKQGLESLEQSQGEQTRNHKPLLAMELDAAKEQGYPITEGKLIADGLGSIFAGTDTTAATLTCSSWAIFSNKAIYDRLHQELKEAWPDRSQRIELSQLEKLPYLSACVKEGLRFSTPIPSRLPRVCPPSGWTYDGYDIPPGTVVSSSSYLMHFNTELFASPESFEPDRWIIQDPAMLKTMEDAWVPFSKGSRQCIGLNLATVDLYIVLATIMRRFRARDVLAKNIVTEDAFNIVFTEELRCILEEATD